MDIHHHYGCDHGRHRADHPPKPCPPANAEQGLIDILDSINDRIEHYGDIMTAFIDAQPAVDAVVAQLATATAEAVELKSERDAALAKVAELEGNAGQTIDLGPLQSSASSLVAELAPAAPPVTAAATLYEHTTDNPVDSTYTTAAVTLPDGTPLYTYSGDVAGSASGATADWSIYAGPTVPVTPASV